MHSEYIETEVKAGDTRSDVLELLADGNPFVFVWAILNPEDGSLNLKAETGGGVRDVRTVRSLLKKALDAMPAGSDE